MKFQKALIAPAALLLAVAGLVSCNSGETGPDASQVKPSGNVVFWSNVYGKREEAWRDQVIADFNKVYPDIKVEMVSAGRYWEIDEKVQANLNTPKKLPNMVVGYPDYFTNYMDKLVDLTPYLDDPVLGFGKIHGEDDKVVDDPKTLEADFVQKYLEEGKGYAKEGTYSLPFGKTTEALFVNDDALKAIDATAPTTWTEAVAVARKMLAKYPERYKFEKEGKNIIGAYAPINFHSTSNLYITFSEMLGIPYASNKDVNGDGKLGKSEAVLFNNPEAKKMVKALKGLFDEQIFTTKDVTAKLGAAKYVEDDFVKKNPSTVLMYDTTKGTSYVANSINKIQEEGKEWQYDGANEVSSAHPVLNFELEGMPSKYTTSRAINQGGSIAFFDHGKEANDCAWLFYKFMTNTDSSAAYSVANSTTPARKSAFETEGIKTIVAGKDTVVTKDSKWQDQFNKLTGEVFELYKAYDTNGQYVAAPVNAFSANQRKAVEDMLINVLISKDTNIDALIDAEFTKAYEAC